MIANDVLQKRCTDCGQEFPATPEFFFRDKQKKDGWRSMCKGCYSVYRKAPKTRRPRRKLDHVEGCRFDHVIADCQCGGKQCIGCLEVKCFGLFRLRKKDKPVIYTNLTSYCRACDGKRGGEAIKQRRRRNAKRWNTAYPGKMKIFRKMWLDKHPEARKQYSKTWREKHPEAERQRLKMWREKHPEVAKTWREKHSEAIRQIGLTRRSRKKAVLGSHTPAQIHEMLQRHHYRCYFCRTKLRKNPKRSYGYDFHVEHTFPISRVAGTDIPANDISYLVPACPTCNLSKGDKFPWEWPEGGRLL